MYINNYYTLHKIKIIKLQHVLNFKKKCMQCLSNIQTECTFIGLQVASPCINFPAPCNFCNCLLTMDTLHRFYSHI